MDLLIERLFEIATELRLVADEIARPDAMLHRKAAHYDLLCLADEVRDVALRVRSREPAPAPSTEMRRKSFVWWMEARGLNVLTVARTAGVPASTIYSFVQGRTSSLTGQNQDRIAHAYAVTVADLFGGAAS